MSTIIVRPNGYLYQSGGWDGTSNSGSTFAAVSNANLSTYLGDNSDTTGVRSQASSGSSYFRVKCAAPTIASDEYVVRVGASLRYSHGQAGKYVGAVPYTTLSSVPGGISVTQVSGSTSPATAEITYVMKAWTKSEAAKLAIYGLAGGGSTTAVRPRLWDAYATVYTIKLATATPQATTWTTSTYPTIPVDVAATIDWEASTYDWQNLRLVTVEVRVESGGTGPGTGTLKSIATGSVQFTATGTQTLNFSMPDALPNGTYKIYARATRYRDGTSGGQPTVATDQIGVWSSAITLTMNAAPPTAPTITATANQTTDSVALSVTPPTSSGYTSPVLTVERSDDAGTTWVPVRGAVEVAATFGSASTFTDYEAKRGTSVQYRAMVRATQTSTSEISGSAYSTASATVNADSWNLKAPELSALNLCDVLVIGQPDETVTEDIGVFRPMDRRYPVIVSGTLSGWDGSLTIHCPDAAAWASLRALIESQRVLLLESPFGWAKYIRLMPGPKVTMFGTPTVPRREVSLAYVECAQPEIV